MRFELSLLLAPKDATIHASRRGRIVVAVVVASMLLLSCGDGGDSSPLPPNTISLADLDRAKARRIVLEGADLPGFRVLVGGPTDDKGPDIEAPMNACLNSSPLLVGLGQDDVPRGALGTDFQNDNLTVASAVTFAGTEDEARAATTELSAASLPRCFAKAMTDKLGRDPTFVNLTVTTERFPTRLVGDQTIGYHTVVRVTLLGKPVTFYLDHTFVRSGRAVAAFEATSARTPFPQGERERLTALIADRMGGS